MPLQNQPKLIGLVVVALLVAAGTGTVIWMNRNDASSNASSGNTPTDTSALTQSSPTTAPSSTPVPSTATYKDGTYSADGTYRSPGGNEKIGVTLTIASGTISDVSIKTYGSGSDAEEYQAQFKDGISAVVVGKKVNDVSVSRVSGSSLTSTGFNNALEIIKSDAQA
ncbi:MAG: FMN-binding protein [Candidatus Saccharibacteria bacterium]|nr:FMN-binding protein [Candidatus Saccharibacteria bacterium]